LIQLSSTKLSKKLISSIIIVVIVASAITAFTILYYEPSTDKHATIELNLAFNQTSVIQGNSLQEEVTVISSANRENITLKSDVGSSGIQCSFNPDFGMGNYSSTLTMSVPDSTPTGNYSVTIIASDNGVHQNATCIVSVLPAKGDKVTVSGNVMLNPLGESYEVSLTQIQFIDTQTNSSVTIDFPYIFPIPASRPYTVSLQNEHTYTVIISYWWGTAGMNIPSSFEVSNFFVNALSGNNTISGQDFKNY
jgi:hypothetical protein